MSANLTTAARRRVSTQHKVAVGISVAYALFSIIYSLPIINGGENDNGSGIPWGVVIVGFVFAVITCVAAYGAWTGQRWGVVLTIVMNALAFIVGAPGIFFSGKMFLEITSVLGCVANVVVIVLLLRRGRSSVSTASQGVAA
jgi:hypothetical protein